MTAPAPVTANATESSIAKPQLWDQQPGESPNAFAIFEEYRQLGPDITLKDFADKTNRSLDAVQNYSCRHHWRERAAAWRHHLAIVRSQAAEQAARDEAALSSTRARIAEQLDWETSDDMADLQRQIISKVRSNPDLTCSIFELTHLIQTTSKLRRRACKRGEEANSAAIYDPAEEQYMKDLAQAYPDEPLVQPGSPEAASSVLQTSDVAQVSSSASSSGVPPPVVPPASSTVPPPEATTQNPENCS